MTNDFWKWQKGRYAINAALPGPFVSPEKTLQQMLDELPDEWRLHSIACKADGGIVTVFERKDQAA